MELAFRSHHRLHISEGPLKNHPVFYKKQLSYIRANTVFTSLPPLAMPPTACYMPLVSQRPCSNYADINNDEIKPTVIRQERFTFRHFSIYFSSYID
jgi:hypothetical protein